VTAPLVPEMVRNYRKWHLAPASDPSAISFWKTAFYLAIGRFAVEIGLVVAIFFILKPSADMFGPRTDLRSPGQPGHETRDDR